MPIPGLLLTGGASRRLGVDKTALVVDGETLARRAARVLATVCDPVLELGPGLSGLDSVREDPPGGGPLAALSKGFSALGARGVTGPVFLLACDLPFVESPLIRLLAEWPGDATVAPRHDGVAQGTCARYGGECVAPARSLLDAEARRDRSLRALLDRVATEVVSEPVWRRVAPAHAFDDIDTPDDLGRIRAQQ
jgi:molybdopterin-guanine dinucleotide biosynthesis protein A